MKSTQKKLVYNNRVNEAVENAAKIICKLSRDRLNILGIKFADICEGGPRIIQLEADGLVDGIEDWILTNTDEIQYTLRLTNIKEGTPNKELLESLNYEWFNRNEFGLFELGRKDPLGYEGSMYYKHGDGSLVQEHKILVFDRSGDIIIDSVSEYEDNSKKFIRQFKDVLELEAYLGKLRAIVVDNILKYGIYDDEIVQTGTNLDVFEGYVYEAGSENWLDISIYELREYNIALIGKTSSCSSGFVVFNKKTNEIIAYGKDTASRIIDRTRCIDAWDYFPGTLWILVAEDCILAVDGKSKELVRIERDIPESMHLVQGENTRDNIITDSLIRQSIDILSKKSKYARALEDINR